MSVRRIIYPLIAILAAAGGFGIGWGPTEAAGLTPQGSCGSDVFGYQCTDGNTEGWIEGVNEITFSSPDDGYSVDLLSIGFPFKFYENIYTGLYVSTNGFISFGSASYEYRNKNIPRDSTPDNIIAPFWDDLYLGASGTAKWAVGGTAPDRYFVVEWEGVQNEPLSSLNFEVVLKENGDILFQYADLTGDLDSLTAGIEDGEGVDGLQYLYNGIGYALSTGNDILFERPPSSARVKVLPLYSSGLAFNGRASYSFTVRNTGDSGAPGGDTYDLEAVSSEVGWEVAFYDATGSVALIDTDSDSVVDTGPLLDGQSLEVTLAVEAPPDAAPGDCTRVDLTVTSSLDVGKSALAQAHSAVPVEFVQAFVDSQGRIRMQQTWQKNLIEHTLLSGYTGLTLAVSQISPDDYLVAWEKFGDAGVIPYTEIEYRVVNRLAGPGATKTFTDSGSQANPPVERVDAQSPAMGASPSGRVGVAWRLFKVKSDPLRPYLPEDLWDTSSNIYFTVLDGAGNLIGERLNLTGDPNWYGTGDSNNYLYPYLAATTDGRFLVCWVKNIKLSGQTHSELKCAVYSYDGGQEEIVEEVGEFTADSTAAGSTFSELTMTSLNGGHVLLTYTEYTSASGVNELRYTVLDSAGGEQQAATQIPGVEGARSRALQFGDGDILLAWTDFDHDQLAFVLLDGSSYEILEGFNPPRLLPLVGDRVPDYLSVALESGGRAALTWMDSDDRDFLYYAVIDQDGETVTPPMVFYNDPALEPLVQTSLIGFGNAPYSGVDQVFIPLVMRE